MKTGNGSRKKKRDCEKNSEDGLVCFAQPYAGCDP